MYQQFCIRFFFINKFLKTYLLSCDDYVPVIKAGCDMSPSAHHDHFNASHAISIQLLSSKQTLSHHDHFIASHAISYLIMQVFGWVANWTMYITKSLCNLTLQHEIKGFLQDLFTQIKKIQLFPIIAFNMTKGSNSQNKFISLLLPK